MYRTNTLRDNEGCFVSENPEPKVKFFNWLQDVEEKAGMTVDSRHAARLFNAGTSVMDAVVELCK